MTYLRLVQTLNIKLPLIDPAHYIHRFAALLEFGDETGKVAVDAVRLVQRFNRDWMTAGRRPAGICGACLLLAARMNNFRRSIQEVVQVVKIADVTLKKRLEEFKKTSSGNLTVADFRKVWLEEEMDPPAFTQGKEREKWKGKEKSNKRKRKRGQKKENESDESSEEEDSNVEGEEVEGTTPSPSKRVDLAIFQQGILAGTLDTINGSGTTPLFLPDHDEGSIFDDKDDLDKVDETSHKTDEALHKTDEFMDKIDEVMDKTDDNTAIDPSLLEMAPYDPSRQSLERFSELDETLDNFLTEEVSEFIENEQGSLLADALDTAEKGRNSSMAPDDDLLGLDEDELDRMILTEEEVKVKERIWVELNRDYLENLAGA